MVGTSTPLGPFMTYGAPADSGSGCWAAPVPHAPSSEDISLVTVSLCLKRSTFTLSICSKLLRPRSGCCRAKRTRRLCTPQHNHWRRRLCATASHQLLVLVRVDVRQVGILAAKAPPRERVDPHLRQIGRAVVLQSVTLVQEARCASSTRCASQNLPGCDSRGPHCALPHSAAYTAVQHRSPVQQCTTEVHNRIGERFHHLTFVAAVRALALTSCSFRASNHSRVTGGRPAIFRFRLYLHSGCTHAYHAVCTNSPFITRA